MRRSFGIFSDPKPRFVTRMPSCRKPALRFIRLRRLPANSSAPTSSTRDKATCATTSARRNPKRSRLAVIPRPLARIDAAGDDRVARNAGASPNRMQVNTASAAVNASMRLSVERSRNTSPSPVLIIATSTRLRIPASATPHSDPAQASNRLSERSWRISRPREAPSASRTAISFSRVDARASIRFARFAQAINSTRPASASRIHSGLEASSRSSESPFPAGNTFNLSARYVLASSA